MCIRDRLRMIATPHSTVTIRPAHTGAQEKDKAALLARVRSLVDEHNVGGIVVGYPLLLSGEQGKSCGYVKQFCKELRASAQGELPPIVLWDERMTTAQVTRVLKDSSRLNMKKQKEKRIDKMCAALILQQALDQLKFVPSAS
eukprot:TRINITY_DN10751_c0_g1_i4.p1 TRINITY_DN10751_c0_g1~~TRINITY_DN10751_c0_g1_i4.p1  ORF type:complete len:143 (-),score=32.78 TRINITY_DN10751_c0_g1_i4:138-566(-)